MRFKKDTLFRFLAKKPPAEGWAAGSSVIELEGVHEGHKVGSFFVGEDEAQVSLVVTDHVLERRGDAVVEIRREPGEGP